MVGPPRERLGIVIQLRGDLLYFRAFIKLDTSENNFTMSSTPRRTSGEIRNLHTQTGAFLFEFEERSWSDPMKGHAENPLCTPLLLEPKSEGIFCDKRCWMSTASLTIW
jgi:hypothetical protein